MIVGIIKAVLQTKAVDSWSDKSWCRRKLVHLIKLFLLMKAVGSWSDKSCCRQKLLSLEVTTGLVNFDMPEAIQWILRDSSILNLLYWIIPSLTHSLT